MAQDKAQQLLSHLLILKENIEGNYPIKTDYQLKRINKAISIVEDSIRYRRAFFTVEE